VDTVTIWSPQSAGDEITFTLPEPMQIMSVIPSGVAWNSNDSHLAIISQPHPETLEWFGEVWIVDTLTGSSIALAHPAPVAAIDWHGATVATASLDGLIRVWEVKIE
jgi:WD40 repeat protein